jgi:hypothetical protein
MPIYIIAAIESKCFYICIFFYNLDICARATFDSPSLDCDEFLFYFSSFVFCCVCVCVYMRVLFSFSFLFSRLRLHLNRTVTLNAIILSACMFCCLKTQQKKKTGKRSFYIYVHVIYVRLS